MSLIDSIYPASYSGISFLVNVTETAGGRKDVVHVFPNKDTQFVEDLGLQPRIYMLTAIINETSSQSYLNKRDSLLNALEAGEPSILIHPFYGLLPNIVARNFSLRENLTKLGDAEIDIEFTVSDSVGTPIASQFSASILNGVLDKLRESTAGSIVANFLIRPEDANNDTDATSILDRFVGAVRNTIVTKPVDILLLDAFTLLLDDFEVSIPSLIYNPTLLSDGLDGIITDLAGLYSLAGDKVSVMRDLFDFGADDTLISQTTQSRIQRQVNRDEINNAVNSLSLGQAYVASSGIEFNNTDEITDLEDILEDQYQFIVA